MILQVVIAVGAVATAFILLLRNLGWINERQPAVEARAEEMWRSEAEAQTTRANRLDAEMRSLTLKLETAMSEIANLKEELRVMRQRPDLAAVLERFDSHRFELADTMQAMTDTLARIATAVIPPDHIRDE